MRWIMLLTFAVSALACCSEPEDYAEATAGLRGVEDALAAAERGEYYYLRASWIGGRPVPDDGLPERVVSDAVPAPQFYYMKHFNLAMRRLAAMREPQPTTRP